MPVLMFRYFSTVVLILQAMCFADLVGLLIGLGFLKFFGVRLAGRGMRTFFCKATPHDYDSNDDN